MGRVSVEDKMRIQTLHEQKLGYRTIIAKYPEKKWSLSTVKAICKRVNLTGQLSSERQEVVDQKLFVRQKTLKVLVNWFVRKKISLEQARVPGKSLRNWTFIDRLFNELWNVILIWLHFVAFQLRSSQNLSNKNVVSAVRNLFVVCQRLW